MVQLNLSGSFLHPKVGVNYLGIVLVIDLDVAIRCQVLVLVENSPPIVQLMDFHGTSHIILIGDN
jgi:hypothetical protein